jgi:hypothetical protein
MEVLMAADPEVRKMAKDFIDSALAARGRLGYSAKISKKSYGRAVDRATDVFERLRGTSVQPSDRHSGASPEAK